MAHKYLLDFPYCELVHSGLCCASWLKPGSPVHWLCIEYTLLYVDVFFYGLIAILSTAGWSEVPAVLSSSTPLVS